MKKKLLKSLDKILNCCIFASLFNDKQNNNKSKIVTIKTEREMKNIEFRATNEFGSTYREKFNGRRFTRLVKKEAAERNVSEYQVLIDFVNNYVVKYLCYEDLVSYEFTWLDEFNRYCKIDKNGKIVVSK